MELSLKLRILSFFSILIVVMNHVAVGEITLGYDGESGLVVFLLRLISGSLARVNRPLFFMISGFLFFLTLRPDREGYLAKWKKRWQTLAIPYLAWSLLGTVIVLVACSLPLTSGLMDNRADVSQRTVTELGRMVILDPIPYQFWYLRDLMLYILCAPLIRLLVTRLRLGLVALAAGLWLLGFESDRFYWPGLYFFCAGGALIHALPWLERRSFPHLSARLALVLWLLFSVLHCHLGMQQIPGAGFIKKISMLFGLATFWIGYERISTTALEWIRPWSSFTFFVFAAHEPLLTAIRKVFFHFVPRTPAGSLLATLWLTAATVGICLLAGWHLRCRFRNLYAFFVGGRGMP